MAEDTRGVRIGVDIGGTFTDLQVLDERTGRLFGVKTPTTPEDPSIGLMTGVKEAAQRGGFALSDVRRLLHGTTIATNAVLERKLAKGALVTTAGFEDVLEIGRHNRRDVYAVNPPVPPALVPRDRRLGLAERIRADGTVEIALGPAALDDLVARLDALDVACVAVCLLNSYREPVHERAVAAHLKARRPGLLVSLSSDISPEIREYERTSTTVLNALLMPVVAGYLDKLRARMEAEGFTPHLLLVQSNGGVCSAQTAAAEPVRLLLSGPAGGTAACARIGAALGEPNLVGCDMGGTSFDVSIVRDGRVTVVTQGEIDMVPVRLPMVEVRTIGAGGGSLARVRPGGRLTVGPESAGARPGPACYGRGGTEPTVTDANVVLGKLDASRFLGGGMRLDGEAARTAVATHVGDRLSLAPEAAAEGLLAVTNAGLGAAIRLSLFEKGLDPREFALLAFGGAAGLHATDVADELGVSRIVFPSDASTLSAYGILHSDLVHDFVRSRVVLAGPDAAGVLAPLLAELVAEANSRLAADRIPEADRVIRLAADMRYRGQAFELTVDAPRAAIDQATLGDLVAAFHALHRQRFSYADPEAAVEIVALRVTGIGRLAPPPVPEVASTAGGASTGTRQVHLGGAWRDVAVWRREDIGTEPVAGPAVVEEAYTTVLVGPGWSCRRAGHGHLIATRTTS